MRRKFLVLLVAAFMLLGSALPALAQTPTEGPDVEPVCSWDWDRYLWRAYEYELWYYGCDYGDDSGWYLYAFWTPDDGYWYP